MDFELTVQQRSLRESVDRYAATRLDLKHRREQSGTDPGFSRKGWREIAGLGWLGAGLPEEAGGFGGGVVEDALIAEALAPAIPLEPWLTTVICLQALYRLSDFEGRAQLIDAVVAGGHLVALAYAELSARGGSLEPSTVAQRTGDGWKVDGAKIVVPGAVAADQFIVSARVEGMGAATKEVGLFLVDKGASGLAIAPYRLLDDAWAGDVTLSNVEATLLGTTVEGADALSAALDYGAVVLSAEIVGLMQACLTLTREHILTRRQFGVALSEFQVLRHRMADMLVDLELSRSLLFQGLAALEGPPAERTAGASATKAFVAGAGLRLGSQAIQLHGAIGITEELLIGHYYRRLRVNAELLGDVDHHLQAFARFN